MRKINDTMNRLTVTAYVCGGKMKRKLADTFLPEKKEKVS